MSTGDGLCAIALALAAVGMSWAGAWAAVRNAGIRAEALRRLGEGAFSAAYNRAPAKSKGATRRRGPA